MGQARKMVSMGADTKANTLGAAAHSRLEIFVSLRTAASLEAPSAPILLKLRLQQRGGARMVRNQACQGALTQKQTLRGRFKPGAAYSSDCSVELPLRPSASAAPPSGPMRLSSRL